jgi:hypothetical protein
MSVFCTQHASQYCCTQHAHVGPSILQSGMGRTGVASVGAAPLGPPGRRAAPEKAYRTEEQHGMTAEGQRQGKGAEKDAEQHATQGRVIQRRRRSRGDRLGIARRGEKATACSNESRVRRKRRVEASGGGMAEWRTASWRWRRGVVGDEEARSRGVRIVACIVAEEGGLRRGGEA